MVTAIIQARTGSTRFPNKVFVDLKGMPMIWHIVERLKVCKKVCKIVIATTNNPKDDTLEKWANENKVECFRGDEDDVLSRYYFSALSVNAKLILRVTADDPFKDPEITDKVITILQNLQLDFAYNNNPPSFPEGLDTEVFTFKALEYAHFNAIDPFEREHVTQYFYRNPELFKQKNLKNNKNISAFRWTIDTELDYKMANEVYKYLYKENEIFLMNDILKLLDQHPEIADTNKDVKRSAMYK